MNIVIVLAVQGLRLENIKIQNKSILAIFTKILLFFYRPDILTKL